MNFNCSSLVKDRPNATVHQYHETFPSNASGDPWLAIIPEQKVRAGRAYIGMVTTKTEEPATTTGKCYSSYATITTHLGVVVYVLKVKKRVWYWFRPSPTLSIRGVGEKITRILPFKKQSFVSRNVVTTKPPPTNT